MRNFVFSAVLLLLASAAQASSYLDIFGNIINPIQYTAAGGGGNHAYSGPNLEPSVTLPVSDLARAELPNADLSSAVLSGSDLSSANLINANLTFSKHELFHWKLFDILKFAHLTSSC